jgi:hypothetical protein
MMVESGTPADGALRAVAIRRFERFTRTMRRAGVALLVLAVAYYAVIWFLLRQIEYAVWMTVIGNVLFLAGLNALFQGFIQQRWWRNVYRNPRTAVERQAYRSFLYSYSRPSREFRLDTLRWLLVFGGPLAAALGLWWAAVRVWPDQRGLLAGVAATLGLIGFILSGMVFNRRARREADAWYAAQFPAGESAEGSG